MTTVDTSVKIVTSIMTLELLESTELDYIDFWCIYRSVSRISGTVLHTVQINFHAVDVNKYRYIQTPIGLLIF